ncbi:SPOR domain-containing protein [Fundidesulfovibrio soli]|uniref:SPOR domain-containing protein n=1 Tax=Fundidesulfovibrio soli TaxID=2922716 RepID=UPI001FAFF402|nr:SPOR domain-containing protein [Fundidesulfovibrio soli]
MKVVDRMKSQKTQDEGPRKFVKEFTVSSLVSYGVVAVLGIIWVFILGVLVGRGYKPENAVPQVAQIMPSAQPQTQQPENKEPPQVLKPEELAFMDSLQGKKPPETVTVDSTKKPQDQPAQAHAAPAQGVAPTPSTLEKPPAPLPKGQVATAPAQPDKKAAPMDAGKHKDEKAAKAKDEKPAKAKDERTAKGKEEKAAKADGGTLRCVYQLASMDKKSQAQEEADRFAKKGLKTSVQEAHVGGKTVWRVVTTLKGTESEIKSSLDKAGAKKPILREKKNL